MRPHRRQRARLHRPWDSPGKNTGVGCHFLLQCMKVKSEIEVAQSCPTLCHPMDCSPPGSSIHGIFQARVLEWGAIAFLNAYGAFSRVYSVQFSRSVVSDSLWPHGLSPWSSPAQNTGVGSLTLVSILKFKTRSPYNSRSHLLLIQLIVAVKICLLLWKLFGLLGDGPLEIYGPKFPDLGTVDILAR